MREIRIFKLDKSELRFPPVDLANKDGILAYGGDLRTERIMLAYQKGIFPWYSEETPILWWAPDPRFVLFPEDLKVSKSMRKVLRSNEFKITFDTAFHEVLRNCQVMPRDGQDGTWITAELFDAYLEIHQKGFAHSVEVWREGELVGGLFGVSLGGIYFGESMFSKASNASKAGFITLVQKMHQKGIQLVDCQVHTNHLESLGAKHISRDHFTHNLDVLLEADTFKGSWTSWAKEEA